MKLLLAFILSLNFATMKKILAPYGYYHIKTLITKDGMEYWWYKPPTDDSLLIIVDPDSRELTHLIFSVDPDKTCGEEVGEIAGRIVVTEFGYSLARAWHSLASKAKDNVGSFQIGTYNGYKIVVAFRIGSFTGRVLFGSGFGRIKQ